MAIGANTMIIMTKKSTLRPVYPRVVSHFGPISPIRPDQFHVSIVNVSQLILV
jgi:hypothetical protein